jgi:hypothetical protein
MLFYNLGLAFWIGGGLALGALAAPTLFRSLDSRKTAGELFGRMLRKYSRIRAVALVMIIGAAAMKTLAWEDHVSFVTSWWIAIRWLALVLIAATLLYELLHLEPAISKARSAAGPDSVTMNDPHFATLHRRSERVLMTSIGAAVIALFLG